jgi:RNAse (barnase) inhibitor barstar
MAIAPLSGTEICEWGSFHDACARELGFPPLYGRNMNAFIDCLSYLDQNDKMSRFALVPGEVLELRLNDSNQLQNIAPDVLRALVDSVGSMNQRYPERGKPLLVTLVQA